jgi:hypothetical protein
VKKKQCFFREALIEPSHVFSAFGRLSPRNQTFQDKRGKTMSITANRPIVRVFYCSEPDTVHTPVHAHEAISAAKIEPSARSSAAALAATNSMGAVAGGGGGVNFSDDEQTVYHRAAEARTVRRALKVHGSLDATRHTPVDLFKRALFPAVEDLWISGRDVLFLAAGDSGSTKRMQLHGLCGLAAQSAAVASMRSGMLDQPGSVQFPIAVETLRANGPMAAFDPDASPKPSEQGLIHMTAEYLMRQLQPFRDAFERGETSISASRVPHLANNVGQLGALNGVPYELVITTTCVQMDYVSDILVTQAATRHGGGAVGGPARQRFMQLVTLSRSTPLDVDQSANGDFTVVEQQEVPINSMADVVHAEHCYAAVTARRAAASAANSVARKPGPLFVVTTFVLSPTDALRHALGSSMARPLRVRLVEVADRDWSARSPDDMAHLRGALDALAATTGSLATWQVDAARSLVGDTTATRVIFADLDMSRLQTIVLGTSRYRGSLDLMRWLAAAGGQAVTVVLQGDANDEDEEMRGHIRQVQSQCESLRREVAELRRRREELTREVSSQEEAILRYQEQAALLKRTSGAAIKTPKDILRDAQAVQVQRRAATERDAMHQRRVEAEQHRAARLALLDHELQRLRDEDDREAAAAAEQIQFLASEARRCNAAAGALEHERDQLARQLRELEASTTQERAELQLQREAAVVGAMDARWSELTRAAQQRSSLITTAASEARARQVGRQQHEAAFSAAVQRPVSPAAAAELRHSDGEVSKLRQRLTEVAAERKRLEGIIAAHQHASATPESRLETEIAALGGYVHRLSTLLHGAERAANAQQLQRALGLPAAHAIGDVNSSLVSSGAAVSPARGAPSPLSQSVSRALGNSAATSPSAAGGAGGAIRAAAFPSLGLPVYDPSRPPRLEVLRGMRRQCAQWLERHAGRSEPAFAYDVQRARMHVLEPGFGTWVQAMLDGKAKADLAEFVQRGEIS